MATPPPDAPLDWSMMEPMAKEGCLMEALDAASCARWCERGPGDRTLLHLASFGPNADAVVALLAHGLDVNARTQLGSAPAHIAAAYAERRVLEVLCAAGADLRARDSYSDLPLDNAVRNVPRTAECVRVLLANGARLNSVRVEFQGHRITPELVAFERGVLRCRAAVVAMLRVKRAGGSMLWMWDKFLLMEIAVCIWATRYAAQWAESCAK